MMELRGKKRMTREANLKKAEGLDDDQWTKATPYHWRRKLKCGHVIDFWPTTMRAQFSWYDDKTGCHDIELRDNAYDSIEALLEYEVQHGT